MPSRDYYTELNEQWFRDMLTSPSVEALTKSKAQIVLAQAKILAPKKDGSPEHKRRTGAYHRSLKIVKVPHEYRNAYKVLSDSPYGLFVEARYHVLKRALRSAK